MSRPANPAPSSRSSRPATPPSPAPADLAQADLAQADLAQALTRAVSGEVRFDALTRGLFARDASMYAIEPIGVVFPRDADDVCAVISTAAQFGVPVLPRGAGTSLAGQTVGRAVVIDLSRHMHDITALDAEERAATVQPGVVQEQLNLRAAADGLIFGPDTSTRNRATIGGMIGNNSSGSHSIRYGCTADHVLELDVVLSDGSRAHLAPISEAERARRAALARSRGAYTPRCPLSSTGTATPSPPATRTPGASPAATGWTGWPPRRNWTSPGWSSGPRARWPWSPPPPSGWWASPGTG